MILKTLCDDSIESQIFWHASEFSRMGNDVLGSRMNSFIRRLSKHFRGLVMTETLCNDVGAV
jgi:hypothetical protein